MGAWGPGVLENDSAMDALSIHLAPLVFELYEGLIYESHCKIPSQLESEVMIAEMIVAIAEKFPQGNITREDALHWKDVALEILDNFRQGRDHPDDWEWIATVESTFDRLIECSDNDGERRPPELFREYYLGWCGQTGRTPVNRKLPEAK